MKDYLNHSRAHTLALSILKKKTYKIYIVEGVMYVAKEHIETIFSKKASTDLQNEKVLLSQAILLKHPNPVKKKSHSDYTKVGKTTKKNYMNNKNNYSFTLYTLQVAIQVWLLQNDPTQVLQSKALHSEEDLGCG